MKYFPVHDGMNGCGMVAMGVLLQFYRDIQAISLKSYIKDAWYCGNADDGNQLVRANLLRDDLTGRTPKFLGSIGSWFGVQNATVSSGQAAGLNSYFNRYYQDLFFSSGKPSGTNNFYIDYILLILIILIAVSVTLFFAIYKKNHKPPIKTKHKASN